MGRFWANPTSQPNTVDTGAIVDNAVTNAKIANGAVTESKLGAGAVTGTKIGAGAVSVTHIADATITLAKLAASASDPAAGTPGLRSLGTTATTACAGNDSRLSDTRTPTDGSVTAAKVNAALKPSGSAAAGDEALRALGTTASTACAGNDSRLSDSRTPTAHASTHAAGQADAIDGDGLECNRATTNYTAGASTIAGHLSGIDSALGSIVSGGVSDGSVTISKLAAKPICRRYATGGNQTISGTVNQITGLTTDINVGADMDNTANAIVIPVDGLYRLSGQVCFNSVSSGSGTLSAQIRKTTTTVAWREVIIDTLAAVNVYVDTERVMSLVAGDEIRLYAGESWSGGDVTALRGADYVTWLSVEYLGKAS